MGEPTLVTACSCTWCQRRSGSVFSVASRWRRTQVVAFEGETTEFQRRGDSGGQVTIRFCPQCGSTVMTELDLMPDVVGVPVGAFADPTFPAPVYAVWCDEKAEWFDFPPPIVKLRDQSTPV